MQRSQSVLGAVTPVSPDVIVRHGRFTRWSAPTPPLEDFPIGTRYHRSAETAEDQGGVGFSVGFKKKA